MITIEGTVTDILGYPTLFFSRDARSPAVSAPINAAAAGGIFARSTSSSLRVLATAPIPAAATARRTGLLNMIENPNTPQKLARSLNKIHCSVDSESFIKSTGFKCRISAMIHADIVATRITIKVLYPISYPAWQGQSHW